jgi:SAM-dependent methyltransferase
MSTVSDAWEAGADDWIRWARTPDVDHFFWRLNLPQLLELVPAPGRLTLDLGCGEGRVARALQARGHDVVGIEASPRLAAAAADVDADPPTRVIVASADAMPLPDGAADLAVASMTILNFDDLDGVVAEVARVLEPGGRLCFSTVHPMNSIVAARRELLGPSSYFDELRFTETRERAGVRMTFHDLHRPLSRLIDAFARAGLLIETLREPVPDDAHVAAHPSAARWRENPCFLHGRAVKPHS